MSETKPPKDYYVMPPQDPPYKPPKDHYEMFQEAQREHRRQAPWAFLAVLLVGLLVIYKILREVAIFKLIFQ